MVKKSESYEELLKKLEEVVSNMENKELNLEDAMRNYEEGINTYNKLYKMLKETEGKVKVIMEGKEERFTYNEEQHNEN